MSRNITKHDPSKVHKCPKKIQLSRIKLPPLESLNRKEEIQSKNNENVNDNNIINKNNEKFSQQNTIFHSQHLPPANDIQKQQKQQKETIKVKRQDKHPSILPPLEKNANETRF